MANYTKENDRELSWDDEISGEALVLLDEGDYEFTVTNMERTRFNGTAKTRACFMAKLTLKVVTEDGNALVNSNLLLLASQEWKLAAFFRSIGQKKPGEALKPNWDAVKGSIGRAHIKQRSYTGNDGKERKVNDVDSFLPPLKKAPTNVPTPEQNQAPKQEAPVNGFEQVFEDIPF